MKVALDGTPLTVPTGGIRRYTQELLAALKQICPQDEFALLMAGTSLLERRWWSIGLPLRLARGGFDVFHGTDFGVPYVPVCASVLTLHDLSPWKSEPWQNASSRVRTRSPWLLRLGVPTLVVTPTEAVRREAILFFALHPDRVVAVPEAASPRFHPDTARRSPRPYFLFVGTLDPRKNLETAVRAWRPLRDCADFRVAGRGRLDQEPGLSALGAVPDADLPALYAGAAALLLPSFYEGFGLPVLEAMQSGTPVIASNDPALTEVAGGCAVHVPSGDPGAWTDAMRAVLQDGSRWREAGLRRAAEFSWERTACRMREVYAEAVRRFAFGG